MICYWLNDPGPKGQAYRKIWAAAHERVHSLSGLQESARDKSTATTRSLPCRFLQSNRVLDRRGRACQGCWIQGCEILWSCTTRESVPGVACCKSCSCYQPDDLEVDNWQPNTSIPDQPIGPRAKGWPLLLDVQQAHWTGANSLLNRLPDYPANRFHGRGIVIAGGGKYWASVYVTVRMLRHVGCTLPIEVWYLGEAEHDARYIKLLSPWNVVCIDAIAHPAPTRCLTGFTDSERGGRHPPFELKSYAVLHSSFQEVLYLDADNYPCTNPTPLFDEPRYRRQGGVFWPDLAHSNNWTHWEQWGVPAFGPLCGFEVGQYLLNKQLAWRQLNLTRWYDDHGDWCYGWGSHHDHGDKGPHRVAWAALRTEPVIYNTAAVWSGCGFLQPGPDGRTPMFVHRCRGKFTLGSKEDSPFPSTPQEDGVNVRYGLPLENIALSFLGELRRLLS